jgi:RNA polymerase sigma-70 factor (ECF subfamily)
MSALFREVFDSTGPALLRYLRRLTGSATDAEEILQETFLKLHCELSSGATFMNIRAWLFRVGSNAVRDLERERRVRAREQKHLQTDKVINIEAQLESRQLTRRTLRRLPRRMCQVLLLWSEGFTYREIAEITGIEAGYVGVLLQRARAAFRKEYERSDGKSVSSDRTRDPVIRSG